MKSNTIRFSGLASGIDTESIVKAMVQPQKAKLDYSVQEKKLLELKKEAWKSINAKVYSFFTGTLTTLKFNKNFGNITNNVSNPNAILLDNGKALPAGNHTVAIQQMAKNATVASKSIDAGFTTSLSSLGISEGEEMKLSLGGGIEVSVRVGETYDLGDGVTQTVSNIIDIENVLNMKIDQALAAAKADPANDGKVFTDVNVRFDTGVKAFIMTSVNTGSEQEITVSGQKNMLDKLGIMTDEDETDPTLGKATFKGDKAVITYNGGITVESESNNIEINGLKFTIIGESASPVTISAVKDTQSQIDFVKKFVEEYNKLIEEINTLIDAPSAKDYRPLTDEQKEAMSESDIKLWNEKINASILRKDEALSSVVSSMRLIVGSSELFKIGVSTGVDWKEKGKLYIDEEKLKAALTKDPNAVDTVLKDVGVNLYDDLKDKFKGIINVKSSNFLFADKDLDTAIKKAERKIDDLEDKLTEMENKYYKKYAAMEKMMSQLNSQSSWIAAQLGGM